MSGHASGCFPREGHYQAGKSNGRGWCQETAPFSGPNLFLTCGMVTENNVHHAQFPSNLEACAPRNSTLLHTCPQTAHQLLMRFFFFKSQLRKQCVSNKVRFPTLASNLSIRQRKSKQAVGRAGKARTQRGHSLRTRHTHLWAPTLYSQMMTGIKTMKQLQPGNRTVRNRRGCHDSLQKQAFRAAN